MKFYFYYDQLGRVACHSEQPIEASKFSVVHLDVTSDQLEFIKRNYCLYIRENKLFWEKTESIINEEKNQALEEEANLIKSKILNENVTLDDVVSLLLKMI